MPLQPGRSRQVISQNISELTHHGSIQRPHKQIVAIALANADRHPRGSKRGSEPPKPSEPHAGKRPSHPGLTYKHTADGSSHPGMRYK
jgi:hypothetical protein